MQFPNPYLPLALYMSLSLSFPPSPLFPHRIFFLLINFMIFISLRFILFIYAHNKIDRRFYARDGPSRVTEDRQLHCQSRACLK